MLFGGFQCTQKGRVRLSEQSRGGAVHVDDFGGIWAISGDAQEVLYYAPDTLAAAMDQQRQLALPPRTRDASVEPLSTSSAAYTVVFRCHTVRSAGGDVSPNDRISKVFSFNRNARGADSLRRDICIVTTYGVLVFVCVPVNGRGESLLEPVAVGPCQEVNLGMRICAATVTSGTAQHLVVCCYDGAFTEVIRAAVVDSTGQLDMSVADAAVGECEVDARGLFRVEGRIEIILQDSVMDVLVTVSDAGCVDVWDVASAQDATARYGSLSWDCKRYGAPTSALLCRHHLWVGLTTGQLLRFPFSSSRGTAFPPLPNSAQVLRSHTSRITALLSVSLGTDVWSCAADSARVNVWDAASAVLRGSFVFSDCGIAAWQVGATQVRTALWGIEGSTGELSLMQVIRSLSNSNDIQARTGEDASAQLRDEVLLDAYRTCWRSLMHQLRHVLLSNCEDDYADNVGDTSSSLQLVEKDACGAGDVRDVLLAIHKMRSATRQLRATEHRGDYKYIERSNDLPSLIEACITSYEQHRRVSHEVDALLRTLNVSSSEATRLTSLEEVEEEVMFLRARVGELQSELTRSGDCRDDDTSTTVSEKTANLTIEKRMQEAQDALSVALLQNGELRAQLGEAQSEVASLTSQLAHTQELLEASGEEVEQLKRSLLAAKRAAEVTASDVSSLFEMESRLHESKGVIAELSTKVDTLLSEASVTTALLQAFRGKQATGKEVLQRVMDTQNDLADDVGALVDRVGAAIVAYKKVQADPLPEHTAALLDVVEGELTSLEESTEKRLRDQRVWFRTQSQELKSTLA